MYCKIIKPSNFAIKSWALYKNMMSECGSNNVLGTLQIFASPSTQKRHHSSLAK